MVGEGRRCARAEIIRLPVPRVHIWKCYTELAVDLVAVPSRHPLRLRPLRVLGGTEICGAMIWAWPDRARPRNRTWCGFDPRIAPEPRRVDRWDRQPHARREPPAPEREQAPDRLLARLSTGARRGIVEKRRRTRQRGRRRGARGGARERRRRSRRKRAAAARRRRAGRDAKCSRRRRPEGGRPATGSRPRRTSRTAANEHDRVGSGRESPRRYASERAIDDYADLSAQGDKAGRPTRYDRLADPWAALATRSSRDADYGHTASKCDGRVFQCSHLVAKPFERHRHEHGARRIGDGRSALPRPQPSPEGKLAGRARRMLGGEIIRPQARSRSPGLLCRFPLGCYSPSTSAPRDTLSQTGRGSIAPHTRRADLPVWISRARMVGARPGRFGCIRGRSPSVACAHAGGHPSSGVPTPDECRRLEGRRSALRPRPLAFATRSWPRSSGPPRGRAQRMLASRLSRSCSRNCWINALEGMTLRRSGPLT